jgi:hypothetical protein
MKRTVPIGFLMTASLLSWVIPRLLDPIPGHAAVMEAPHMGEGGLPQFEKDPQHKPQNRRRGAVICGIWSTGFSARLRCAQP